MKKGKLTTNILNKHHLLKDNQFYKSAYKKTAICLHHTSGGTAQSSIDWWNKKPDHICTPILIPRNGEIWELFDTKYWAYALGKTNYGSSLEKRTVHFEIANYGGLIKGKDGKFYSWSSQEIKPENVIQYKEEHRGFFYFERYTDAQVLAIVKALDFYVQKHKIRVNPQLLEKFWWGSKKPVGIYSHTTVRGDKSDIHPQPNLIKAIYDHFGCTARVTE